MPTWRLPIPSGIRHPEELSFAKPLESQHLKYNYQSHAAVKSQRGDSLPADTNTFISKNGSAHSSNNSLDGPGTPRRLNSSAGHLNTVSRGMGLTGGDAVVLFVHVLCRGSTTSMFHVATV